MTAQVWFFCSDLTSLLQLKEQPAFVRVQHNLLRYSELRLRVHLVRGYELWREETQQVEEVKEAGIWLDNSTDLLPATVFMIDKSTWFSTYLRRLIDDWIALWAHRKAFTGSGSYHKHRLATAGKSSSFFFKQANEPRHHPLSTKRGRTFYFLRH